MKDSNSETGTDCNKETSPTEDDSGERSNNNDGSRSLPCRSKLRILVITMGGDRQKHIEELFSQPVMQEIFVYPPTFVEGVPNRKLRNRYEFFKYTYDAGLLPKEEWDALHNAHINNPLYQQYPERLYECLKDIPITSVGRRGNVYDLQMHYSVELWKKARTINRGRAVLACTLAHLIALKKLVTEEYDLLIEDNVRVPLHECKSRIWETMNSIKEWENEQQQQQLSDGNNNDCQKISCHLRYMGWLGSSSNIRWIYNSHLRKKQHVRKHLNNGSCPSEISTVEIPTTQDIEIDLQEKEIEQKLNNDINDSATEDTERKPGGNAVWGAYAYWISKEAYHGIMNVLRNDVGALVWKSKRMRHYMVKPIDKIIPRCIITLFGQSTVRLASHPIFYRAPMLTSKIHTQWDPEFCKSTEFQLKQTGLDWSDVWLTESETQIIKHYKETGEWLTLTALQHTETFGRYQ